MAVSAQPRRFTAAARATRCPCTQPRLRTSYKLPEGGRGTQEGGNACESSREYTRSEGCELGLQGRAAHPAPRDQ